MTIDMMDNHEKYFECKKCKETEEIEINERTKKPYLICANCRDKCGGGRKAKKTTKQGGQIPYYKEYLKNGGGENKPLIFDLTANDEAETESNKTDNDEDNEYNIMGNGELIAGHVNCDDDNKDNDNDKDNDKINDNKSLNFNKMTLNDKLKFICEAIQKGQKTAIKTTTDEKNEEVIDNIINLLYELEKTMKKNMKDMIITMSSIQHDIKEIKDNIL